MTPEDVKAIEGKDVARPIRVFAVLSAHELQSVLLIFYVVFFVAPNYLVRSYWALLPRPSFIII